MPPGPGPTGCPWRRGSDRRVGSRPRPHGRLAREHVPMPAQHCRSLRPPRSKLPTKCGSRRRRHSPRWTGPPRSAVQPPQAAALKARVYLPLTNIFGRAACTTGKSLLELRIKPKSYPSMGDAASPYHDAARSMTPSPQSLPASRARCCGRATVLVVIRPPDIYECRVRSRAIADGVRSGRVGRRIGPRPVGPALASSATAGG